MCNKTRNLTCLGCSLALHKALLLFMVVLFFLPITAQNNLNSNSNSEKVTLHLKWMHAFQFAGYYAAQEQGYYKAEGLDVNIIEASYGNQAIYTLMTGKAQYGVWGSELLNKRLSGEPFVVLAVIFQHSPYAILTRKDRNIRVVSDLIGKRIMAAEGQGSAQLKAMLMHEGISTVDLEIVDATWRMDDIIDGTVDAEMNYITDQPNQMQLLGVEPFIIKPIDYGIDFYGDCLFTTELEIKQHPKRVEAFKRASLKGWEYALSHVDEMIELIIDLPGVRERGLTAQHLRYEAEQMQILILPKLIEIGHINPGRWKHIADTYVSLGMLDPDYSLEGFIYTPDPPADYRWIYTILFSLIIILIIALIAWAVNRQLHKVIARRTYDLTKSKEKAEESDRLKTAFLQNISHEIRTPMSGILGFVGLLNKSGLTGEEQKHYIEIISSSSKRMLSTLNDIMDISMLETGQVKYKISMVNINDKLKNLYNFFKPDIENKGIEFYFSKALPTKEMNVKTDREKLYAILTNLIKNSIKYTHKGSINFGYEKKGEFLEFYVKDTGIGIPKERQKAVFDRFVQADIADVKVYEGSGLGLSISKAYVEMLGGEIWVDSVEGKGSQFYFTIPYNIEIEKTPLVQSEKDTQKNAILKKLKILITEDEDVADEYLTIILRKSSKEILHAKSGEDTIKLCRKNPDLDLILMDIKMPGMDGYEATREIRKFNTDVTIIAQTAYALAGDREKALVAGCDDYISKPIKQNALLEMIEKHLKK